MAANKDKIPRGQQLYFRYISLFGKAVTLTIKAYIRNIVNKRKESLDIILTDRKEHIKTFYSDLYKALFKDDNHNFDAQIESWGLSTLCGVVFVLTDNSQIDCVKCILDQKVDLENYAEKSHMDYDIFIYKWNGLTNALLRLCADTDVNLKCKRLIHSFDESKDIQISKEVYKNLQRTSDVNRHFQIVSENDVHTDCNSDSKMPSDVDKDKQTVQFEIQLSDIVVNIGETVTLSCKLNKDELRVIWSKNGDILINTKRVNILANQGTHVLLIQKATTEDSGNYTCEYQDLSTSASVIVSKQELYFGKHLHIEDDGDIREKMKISLSCTINIPGKIPSWFHNDQEFDGNNENVTIISTHCEHKLIIHHFELADEGEYMIAFDRLTSKTSLTIKDTKGPKDLIIQKHMKEELFKYWMRGVLGLKYLKLGLESPAEKAVTTHHEQIVKDIPLSVIKCTECNCENLLPLHSKSQCPRMQRKQKCLCSRHSSSRRICPNDKQCSKMYDLIVHDHRFEDPALKNSSMDKWRTDAWSIAACYMSHEDFIHPSEYRPKVSAKELDSAELLTLFVNNKSYLKDTKYGVFQMAKMHRNELLHNASYEITKAKLNEYLTDFQDVLKVTDNSNQRVFPQAEVEQSLKALIELQNNEIDINTKEEIELMKRDIRGTSMNEAAKQLESALRKKDEEFRNFEEKIKAGISKTGGRESMCVDNSAGSSLHCGEHNILFCRSCEKRKYRQREPTDDTDSGNVRVNRHKKIVVAIEVGNEWSDCAFSFNDIFQVDPLRIESARSLKTELGVLLVKTRSVLLFDEDKKFHSFGFDAEERYAELAEESEHHKWFFFKHFIVNLSGRHITLNKQIEDVKGRKMKAIDVIGSAIKHLKDQQLNMLEMGMSVLQNNVKDIHWVLTVPATWTDSAKQLMEEAAYKADIAETQLTIVTEPEAAIEYYQTEKQIRQLTTADISSPGTKCMVIDLGGNTTYFTILERQSDGGLLEIKAATCIAYGENIVIEEFHELICNIIGDTVYQKWIDEYAYDQTDLQNEIETKLRKIKTDDTGKLTFRVPVSIIDVFREINHESIGQATERSQYKGRIAWKRDKLRIDAEIVKIMFKPYTDMIVDNVQHLLKEPEVQGTSIFLMVGGFSQSSIVQEAIIKAFPTVNVIIPEEPSTVVLKGAVIYGHQH